MMNPDNLIVPKSKKTLKKKKKKGWRHTQEKEAKLKEFSMAKVEKSEEKDKFGL